MITERAVRAMFFERLMQAAGMGFVNAISTSVIDSDQDSEDYAWLGQVPQMSEKKGEKNFDQLRETEWNVKNVIYQGGIRLPKKWILYDKTGQVRVRVGEQATRAEAHWAKLVSELIANGASTACYDGQFYFDTDHEEGDSGAQSNDINADISAYSVTNHGTVTAPSAGEFVHAVMDAIKQMLAFKDDKGEYVNENMTDFLVMVAPSLLTAALPALNSQAIDRGDSNLILSQDSFNLTLQATPRLSDWTDKFAVFNTQGDQKPFIRQQRSPNQDGAGFDMNGIEYVSLWTDSEHYKKNDECLVSVETERAAAYGDWKKGCLVTMT